MGIAEKLAKERRARLAAKGQKSRKKWGYSTAFSRRPGRGLARDRMKPAPLNGMDGKHLRKLERANLEAEVARQRLWEAMETSGDGFAVFDPDKKLVTANNAYLDLFGPGKITIGDDYDKVLRLLSEAVSDLGGADRQDWRHAMIARLAQPVIEPQSISLGDGRCIRFSDNLGGSGDLISIVVDVTETMKREAELEEARAKAESANRAKSTFLTNMSHEIRTPMNGVVGMADLLCETDLTEEQRLFAETIKSSGEALLAIINDVLDYSKIEAERLRLYPEPFDLERCLHEVMLLLQPLAREKGLKLVVDFDLFLPTRYIADPGRMRQIFVNLIGNAVKFTQEGHVLVRVVGVETPERTFNLHITVEDTGIGIPPEHINHVFGQFNQVEDQTNRQFEGTGLGLAITRQLVELMGGTIWVESELGQGSCFGLQLALTPAEERVTTRERQCPRHIRHALVVDDVQINRVILERQLETYGVSVTGCRTPGEAIHVLSEGTLFDVILTDFEMPEMNGPELAARIRAAGVRTPILLLSSHPDLKPDDTADMAAVLEKPILRSRLLEALMALQGPGKAPELSPLSAAEPVPPRGGKRLMRVLAAEDNRTNQLVFRKMVAGLDIDLQFARNGHEAVALWRSFRPDIVFMDISMPGLDGRDATRAIRGIEAKRDLPRTPIVALTAHAMAGDSESILASGVDHYLTKPLKKLSIAAKIIEYCPTTARLPVASAEDLPEASAAKAQAPALPAAIPPDRPASRA